MWAASLTSNSLWGAIYEEYWSGALGMVLGSFIAGSTPLGGGVIAFPIAVLILELTPSEGRDVSVMIQSIGMNAAAWILVTTKPRLLDPQKIVLSCIAAVSMISLVLPHPPYRHAFFPIGFARCI